MSADADLDDLYGTPPEEFMARRKELVAAARKRGDPEAATAIGASRRPTGAAWAVNALVRRDPSARDRLAELTEALRAAHAALDGAKIRDLTATQRRLVDELVGTAVDAAGRPANVALRNDVADTLQAAIADPDVAARLGRLEKAERWSGFGDFGEVAAVAKAAPAPKRKPASPDAKLPAARAHVAAARADVEAATRTHDGAREVLSARTAKLATARRRYEKLLETLSTAEGDVDAADAERAAAERVAHAAADALASAAAALADAEAEVQRLAASTDSSS